MSRNERSVTFKDMSLELMGHDNAQNRSQNSIHLDSDAEDAVASQNRRMPILAEVDCHRTPTIKPLSDGGTTPIHDHHLDSRRGAGSSRPSRESSVEITIVSVREFPENNTSSEDDEHFAGPDEIAQEIAQTPPPPLEAGPFPTTTTTATTTTGGHMNGETDRGVAPSTKNGRDPSAPDGPPDDALRGDPDFPEFRGTALCYPLSVYKKDWRQVKNEVLAGFIVAFAQIPETVAYAFIAGVDPIEALQATYIVGAITSVFGGRPTMISGATGAIAAVQATLPDQGYIYPVCIISGILIAGCGALGLTKFARLIPHSAMIGFLNGLAIIIAESQVHVFAHTETTECVLMAIASLVVALIVYFLPRATKIPGHKMVPSSLAGITVAVIIEYLIYRTAAGIKTKTIGDLEGELSGGWPTLLWMRDDIELPALNWNNLVSMAVPSFWILLVAISEDVMTIEVVSEMTNTRPKTTEGEIKMVQQQIVAMGASNIIGGLLGTMGGGSTIGASIVACFQGSNGRYRICGVVTALSILLTVMVGHSAIAAIPASALVGIIACTVHHTFEYQSVYIVVSSLLPQRVREWVNENVYHKSMRKIQRADAFVITLVTVLTLISNLGVAISAGLLFSSLVYSWQSANNLTVAMEVVHLPKGKEMKIYHLEGPLFFGNARSIVAEFTPKEDPHEIEIHLRDAQIYDYSAINALNAIAAKYKKLNKSVHLKHISDSSQKLITKAHDLISHFTYDTVSRAHSHGSFDLSEAHKYHIAQYPK